MEPDSQPPWMQHIKARNLQGALHLLLDVLEPLGPLSAQMLWVLQPAAGILGGRRIVGDIATALEEPGGIERLRQQLAAPDHEDPT